MPEFNTNLMAEITKATQEIFSTMIMMNVEAKDMENGAEVKSNISTMIGLGGDIRGLLVIHFPKEVAVSITSSFLGMTVEALDEDVKDAVGEIANMMAGNLKIFFADNSIQTELAIPTAVIGKSYRTGGLTGAENIMVLFSCEPGVFLVELKYILNS